jgi:hypothetical protein
MTALHVKTIKGFMGREDIPRSLHWGHGCVVFSDDTTTSIRRTQNAGIDFANAS